MRQATRLDHEERTARAVQYLAEHLDEQVELSALADLVGLSRFHFHRVFRALIGETVGELVRRLRLERASQRLRTSDAPITELALEAGYSTHEAFVRAFRAAFGYAPSEIRRRGIFEDHLPTPNGVHYRADGGLAEIRFARPVGGSSVDVVIRDEPARRAVCIEHRGPSFMIGRAFTELEAWLQQSGTAAGPYLAIFYDDGDETPPAEQRSDAGAFVPDGFTIRDPRVHAVEVEAGAYAVATHHGRYDGLPSAWTALIEQWLPASGYELRPAPSFEVYLVADMSDPASLRTELCLPVRAPAG